MRIQQSGFCLRLLLLTIFLTACAPDQAVTATQPASELQAIPTHGIDQSILQPRGWPEWKRTISLSQLQIDSIEAATLSPDGSTMAISSSKGIRLVDTISLEDKGSISVLASVLAFQPDGQVLAIVHDGLVQFWHLDSGILDYFAGTTNRGAGRVNGEISFSPDGKYVGFGITGSCDGIDSRFELRDVSTQRIVIERETCAHWVKPVFGFDRRGETLTLGYMDDRLPESDKPGFYAEIIDIADRKSIVSIPWVPVVDAGFDGHTVAVYDIADVFAQKKNAWILDVDKNRRQLEIRYPESFVSFSPDGIHFLAESKGRFLLQNVRTGQTACDIGDLGSARAVFDRNGDRAMFWTEQAIFLVDFNKCRPR